MLRKEGYKGFFKGNLANLGRATPFSAFEFFFYEFYKYHLFPDRPMTDYKSKLICGGLTGITASFIVSFLTLINMCVDLPYGSD